MLIPDGNYIARLVGANEQSRSGVVIYHAESGAYCAAVPFEICEGQCAGNKSKHTLVIINKDGSVNERNVELLRKVFDVDGTLDGILALMDNEYPDVRFEMVMEQVSDTNEDGKTITYSKSLWMNAMGGSFKIPDAVDRRAVLAQYGSQFRALNGGTPVKTTVKQATPAAPPPPAKPTTPKAPASPRVKTSTSAKCWEEFRRIYADKKEDEKTKLWFDLLKARLGTDDTSAITPQQWGMFEDCLTDNVPF